MTERAFSPESANDTTSNSRMGELVLAITQETIPKSPSYFAVAKVYMDYYQIKQVFGEDSERSLQARARYDEYLSRMDPDENGLMMMEFNRLISLLIEEKS